jgi:hypothetical protein
LRFADSDSSNWVAFQSPATVASNVTWTLPSADGTSNQVLATNGSGTLSWATAGGGASISAGDSKVEVTDTGSNGTIVFNTDNAERMRVDSSGNVGIGTTSLTSRFKVTSSSAESVIARFTSTGSPACFVGFAGSGASFEYDVACGAAASNVFAINTGSTERARINSGGEAKFSTTGNYPSATAGGHQFRTNANSPTLTVDNNIGSGLADTITQITLGYAANTSNSYFVYCNDSSAARMYVRTDGGIGNYSGNNVNLSDQREKKDFAPAKNYLDVICNIPVQTFNYIDQSEDNPGLTLGVVAQDVQAVAPELVMESDWSTEKDGSKMRLSIYQTDLQYALMKSIQELKAINDAQATRIETLEAQNAAFETRLAALEAN